MDMNLGDTQLILKTCQAQGLLRNQAAYVLATAYWETARTMEPVEEAYYLAGRVSDLDAWRKNNLRYYPWHGRGYTQVTWQRNYAKLKDESGVDVIANPSLAMRPDVAVIAMVVGAKEGWWTGKKLSDYITLQKSNYRGARRVINGTDKASAIAEIARDYEADLLAIGYGVEKPAPIVNERRDGTGARSRVFQSSTKQATVVAAVATVADKSEVAKTVVGNYSEAFGVSPSVIFAAVVLLALAWIFKERLRKWAQGDR